MAVGEGSSDFTSHFSNQHPILGAQHSLAKTGWQPSILWQPISSGTVSSNISTNNIYASHCTTSFPQMCTKSAYNDIVNHFYILAKHSFLTPCWASFRIWWSLKIKMFQHAAVDGVLLDLTVTLVAGALVAYTNCRWLTWERLVSSLQAVVERDWLVVCRLLLRDWLVVCRLLLRYWSVVCRLLLRETGLYCSLQAVVERDWSVVCRL